MSAVRGFTLPRARSTEALAVFHALKTYLGIGTEPVYPRPPESLVEAISRGLHAITLCGKIGTPYADCRFRIGHEQDALVLAGFIAPHLSDLK